MITAKRRRLSPILIATVLLAGCGVQVSRVPLPTVSEARSVLFVAMSLAASTRLEAHVLAEDPGFVIEEGTYRLFFYAEELRDLGLVLDGDEVRVEERGAPCRLLDPVASFEWTPASSSPGSWTALELMPKVIADLLVPDRLPRCRRCLSFEPPRSVVLPNPSGGSIGAVRVRSAAWLDSGAALVGITTGHLLRVDPSQAAVLSGCEGREYDALVARGQNRFSAGGNGGFLDLLRIDADERSCVVETSTTVPHSPDLLDDRLRQVPAIAAARTADPMGLALITSFGEIFRHTSGRFEHVLDLPAPTDTSSGTIRATIVPLADGGLLAASATNRIARIGAGGEISVDRVTLLDAGQQISEVAEVPPLGLLAGDDKGGLWRFDAGEWVPILGSSIVTGVGTILALEGGALLSTRGALHYYSAERGFCDQPTSVGAANSTGHDLLLRGNGLIFAAGWAQGDDEIGRRPSQALWFQLLPEPED